MKHSIQRVVKYKEDKFCDKVRCRYIAHEDYKELKRQVIVLNIKFYTDK